MPDFSSYTDIGSSNILILLAVVIGLSAFVLFVLPSLLKSRNFRVNTQISVKKLKQHPVTTGVTAFLVVVILAGGYMFYLQGRPQIVSAEDLNNGEAASLEYIQTESRDYFVIKNSDMYILDVRSRQDYAKEHIKGSFNVPVQRLRDGFALPKDRKITVYSSKDTLSEAREAADLAEVQVESKVYVVKGGFQSLKQAGLETEKGYNY